MVSHGCRLCRLTRALKGKRYLNGLTRAQKVALMIDALAGPRGTNQDQAADLPEGLEDPDSQAVHSRIDEALKGLLESLDWVIETIATFGVDTITVVLDGSTPKYKMRTTAHRKRSRWVWRQLARHCPARKASNGGLLLLLPCGTGFASRRCMI